MRVSLGGKSCLGVAAAVVVAMAFLGSAAATSEVSGNKIKPISSYADLLFPISDSTSNCHQRYLLPSDSQSSPPAFFSTQQPPVLMLPSTARRLPCWCWSDSSAYTWDAGSSLFFNLWRRLQLHPSVTGVLPLRWLDRSAFNRRFARSVHLGAHVHDAPATHCRRIRLLHRHRRRRLPFQIQGFLVIWSSTEDLYVNWLL